MNMIKLLRGTAAAAIVTAMIFAASPSNAAGRQDRDQRSENVRHGGWHGNNRGEQRASRPERPQQRNWSRSEQRAQPAPNIRREERNFDRRQAMRQAQRQEVRRESHSTWQRDNSYGANRIAAQRHQQIERRAHEQARTNYREGYRDGRRVDRRDDRYDRARAYHNGYREARRHNRDDYRRDYRQWNRSHWRTDRRYNWENYRRSHRNIYRLNRYYAPYRNYSYRRLGIGFILNSLFYSDRYWINDPGYYRLPPVYGPYRWVRYYDDALLVDIYTGRVVDVIHGIFW